MCLFIYPDFAAKLKKLIKNNFDKTQKLLLVKAIQRRIHNCYNTMFNKRLVDIVLLAFVL